MSRYEEAYYFIDYGIVTYKAILASVKNNLDISNPEEYAREIYDAVIEIIG